MFQQFQSLIKSKNDPNKILSDMTSKYTSEQLQQFKQFANGFEYAYRDLKTMIELGKNGSLYLKKVLVNEYADKINAKNLLVIGENELSEGKAKIKNMKTGEIERGNRIVAILTGNGLKDPSTAVEPSAIQPVVLPSDEDAILAHINRKDT